jgi:hypothetical protein
MTRITAKRLGLSFVVCLLLGSVSAAPIFAATVSACPLTGSYQTLLTLGSCSILDKIFTNFQFTTEFGRYRVAAKREQCNVQPGREHHERELDWL